MKKYLILALLVIGLFNLPQREQVEAAPPCVDGKCQLFPKPELPEVNVPDVQFFDEGSCPDGQCPLPQSPAPQVPSQESVRQYRFQPVRGLFRGRPVRSFLGRLLGR